LRVIAHCWVGLGSPVSVAVMVAVGRSAGGELQRGTAGEGTAVQIQKSSDNEIRVIDRSKRAIEREMVRSWVMKVAHG
jgi:hypothetical protein